MDVRGLACMCSDFCGASCKFWWALAVFLRWGARAEKPPPLPRALCLAICASLEKSILRQCWGRLQRWRKHNFARECAMVVQNCAFAYAVKFLRLDSRSFGKGNQGNHPAPVKDDCLHFLTTGEHTGEQANKKNQQSYIPCGLARFFFVSPAHHMQIQGRLLASSKRPFSLGNQGFAVR